MKNFQGYTRSLIFAFVLLLIPHIGATSEKNDSLLASIIEQSRESESDSLLIFQDGQMIYSDFFGGTDKVRNVQSVTKSICSIAIGILVDEGKISSLELPMSKWIPNWSEDSQKSKISLRMIMSHTSGLPMTASWWFEPVNRIVEAIKTPLEREPGSSFLYSNVGATLLQTVIAQASGQNPSDFIQSRIFDPLGITDSTWFRDSAGNESTSGGLYLSSMDLAKIGQLVLSKGRWKDANIVSENFVQEMTTKSQTFKDYGLLWWLSKKGDMSFAEGWGGQFIVIVPSKKIVAVRTKDPATVDDNNLQKQYFRNFPKLINTWE